MATLQGYEIIDQTAFRISAVREPQSVLGAEYGAGYADFVNVGPTVREFVAVAGMWANNSFYGTIGGQNWLVYYRTFLQARISNGNEPFVISWLGAYWLVGLVEPATALECIRSENSDIFKPEAIRLKQRRVVGVDFNADGSMVEP
jgi:hypothetical protein